MKTRTTIIIIALGLQHAFVAQADGQDDGQNVIARLANTRIANENAGGAAAEMDKYNRARRERVEEQRRQILWERDEAERKANQQPVIAVPKPLNPVPMRVGDAEWQRQRALAWQQVRKEFPEFTNTAEVMKATILRLREYDAYAKVNDPETWANPWKPLYFARMEKARLTKEQAAIKSEGSGSSKSGGSPQGAVVDSPDSRLTAGEPPSDSGAEFRRGFKDGFKKADPYGSPPFAPLPEFDHDSYSDGFGLGYAQAMQEEAKRKAR